MISRSSIPQQISKAGFKVKRSSKKKKKKKRVKNGNEGGFNVINKATDTGVVTETGFSVNSTGQLVSMGTRKIQSFAGSLASSNAASTAY